MKSNTKALRLSLGMLALASATAVYGPRATAGMMGTQQTCPGVGCEGGPFYCDTITWSATGTKVDCYDWW